MIWIRSPAIVRQAPTCEVENKRSPRSGPSARIWRAVRLVTLAGGAAARVVGKARRKQVEAPEVQAASARTVQAATSSRIGKSGMG